MTMKRKKTIMDKTSFWKSLDARFCMIQKLICKMKGGKKEIKNKTKRANLLSV